MDNSQKPNQQPNYSVQPLVIYHSFRQDLSEVETEALNRRLAASTISLDAWYLIDEMRVEAVSTLANIPFSPENPATYAALVLENKVRAMVLSEILSEFKDRIRG